MNNIRNAIRIAPGAFALVVLVLLALSGCAYIPTPGHTLDGARAVASFAETERLSPGITTRADVLLSLGAPTHSLKDDRFFIYKGSMTEGYLVIGGPMPGAGAVFPNRRGHLLILEFAADNRLLRLARFDDSSVKDLWAEAQRWMDGKTDRTPPETDQPETEIGP